jgi:hypothetical protein
MVPFRENTFYLFAWRAFLTALIGLVLMATRSVEVAAALLIGANVALLFSFGLIVWSEQLTEERIVWTEAWRMLKPSQRPVAEPAAGGRTDASTTWRCASPRAHRLWRLLCLHQRSCLRARSGGRNCDRKRTTVFSDGQGARAQPPGDATCPRRTMANDRSWHECGLPLSGEEQSCSGHQRDDRV